MAQEKQSEEWVPFTVGRAVVLDLTTLTWTLSATPDGDWVAAFRSAAMTKSGSMEYVLTGSDPTIVGDVIEWRVGPKDHLDANARVREKVKAANAAYRHVLARRAEERERDAAKRQADEVAINEAQRRLDDAGDLG